MLLKEILVKDWTTRSVISTAPDVPIVEVHKLMKEYGIRRLPVVDKSRLVGIVTIGDVREAQPSDATTLSIWEMNYLWSRIVVKDVMQKNVVTVRQDAPMIDAAQLMLDKKISGLPVVDSQGAVVGIDTFGESAPANVLFEHFGFTVANVVKAAKQVL